MKPFFRFLAATLCLLVLIAGMLWHLGGKQMDYVAETTIQRTTVQNVMDHLCKPELVEQWAFELVELSPADGAESKTGTTAKLTFQDDAGLVDAESQFLFASDDTLTVRTNNQYFDLFSTWQLIERDDDVIVRQLMLGTHKGLSRFTALFNKQSQQETMSRDLVRLKEYVESGAGLRKHQSPGDPKKQ